MHVSLADGCAPRRHTQTALLADANADAAVALGPSECATPRLGSDSSTGGDDGDGGGDVHSLRTHSKHVTALRWSRCGRFLASASADKRIFLYLTCSRDPGNNTVTAHVSGCSSGVGSGRIALQMARSIECASTPECLEFMHSFKATDAATCYSDEAAKVKATVETIELIVGLREQCYLLYIDCSALCRPLALATSSTSSSSSPSSSSNSSVTAISVNDAHSSSSSSTSASTLPCRHVSLNEHAWDRHVSFSPLQLSLSPCQRLLLVATDNNMHIVLRAGTNRRLRTLVGHTCGQYGKPAVCWDNGTGTGTGWDHAVEVGVTGTGALPISRYVYSNSQDSAVVMVYSVASGRVVAELGAANGRTNQGQGQGHFGTVRGVSAVAKTTGARPGPAAALIVTASYDKSVKVWRHTPAI